MSATTVTPAAVAPVLGPVTVPEKRADGIAFGPPEFTVGLGDATCALAVRPAPTTIPPASASAPAIDADASRLVRLSMQTFLASRASDAAYG